MMEDGLSVLRERGYLVAAAPTGIGKTAAALAAALEVAKEADGKRTVLFMTGRQSQHAIVVDTVRRINERIGPDMRKIRLVDLIGQQGMCIHEISQEPSWIFGRSCAQLRRERSCSYFLKDSSSVLPRVLEDPLHVQELVDLCRNYSKEEERGRPGICPWKVGREGASSADVIVCDYNHVFLDRVRNASLESWGVELSESIIIVDEAHNLPDRIRRGLERRLTAKIVRDARFEMQEHCESIEEAIEDIDSSVSRINRLRTAEETLERFRIGLVRLLGELRRELVDDDGDVAVPVQDLLRIVTEARESHLGTPISMDNLIAALDEVEVELDEEEEEQLTAAERLADLLRICRILHDDPALAMVFDRIGDEGRITTHLLDPGVVSEPLFEEAAGGILMSGTLFPPEMYGRSLRIPENRINACEEYESPFMADRRPVLVATDVTTRFRDRSDEMTGRIRNHVHSILKETPGHVAVFCPSYSQLKTIIDEGSWPGRRVIIEDRAWRKREVDRILEELHSARRQRQRVLLAGVYNAKLSEGIDYDSNILDAVVCIGIPLAPPSARQDALKEYVADRFGAQNKWRYASAQPAMNSILQAMGRPIRKADDRALVLLLDKRVRDRGFRACLPRSLTMIDTSDGRVTARHARRFFDRHPDPARTP